MRSTSRMVGVCVKTVTKMLIDSDCACAEFQHDALRNLTCERLKLDEIQAFVAKNVPDEPRVD